MKRFTVVSGICASFLLGAAITALSQEQDEHRNDKQDNARPENRQEQARPQEQSRPEDRRNQEPQSGDRHPQNQENDRQTQDRQQQPRQQEDKQQQQGRQQPQQPRPGGNEPGREVNGRQDQARPEGQARGAESRGGDRRGGNQRRIPDADFHTHFGREHHFAPGRMQVYNGQPQFYYGGYTFALIQAWPSDWAYDADDYYIDEFDGEYWLFNLENPGLRLELIIVQ